MRRGRWSCLWQGFLSQGLLEPSWALRTVLQADIGLLEPLGLLVFSLSGVGKELKSTSFWVGGGSENMQRLYKLQEWVARLALLGIPAVVCSLVGMILINKTLLHYIQ